MKLINFFRFLAIILLPLLQPLSLLSITPLHLHNSPQYITFTTKSTIQLILLLFNEKLKNKNFIYKNPLKKNIFRGELFYELLKKNIFFKIVALQLKSKESQASYNY